MSDEDRIDEAAEPVVEEPGTDETVLEAEPEAQPEPGTEPEAETAVEPTPEPEPVAAAPVTSLDDLEPPRNRTGLVVVIVAIVLLLIAAVVGIPLVYQAMKATNTPAATTSTPSRQKITVGIDFVEALLNGDTLAIKSHLTDTAQKAITDEQWQGLASQDASAIAQFSTPAWSGDSTAVVTLTAQDATGTLTFSVDPAKPLSVVLKADLAGSVEMDVLTLVQAGTGWRVVSLSNGTETTKFDAELIKSMITTPTMGQ